MSGAVKSPSQELRELMRLALPIALAQAGMAMMGFVDTLVVGRAGTSALAAVGLANGLFFFISGLGMGLMMGLDPLVSQAFGARNPRRARGLLWQGLWLALGSGVALWGVVLLTPGLLSLFDVAREELPQVREYMLWRAPGLPLMLVFFAQRTYLQAVGRPRAVLVAAVSANLLNLVADVVLVFGGQGLPEALGPLRALPALGPTGAALSSTLCAALMVGVLGRAVRQVPCEGGVPSRRPVAADLRAAWHVGLPIGLHLVAEIGVFALAGVLAARLGPRSISAHQIALSYGSMSFCVALGIGNAGSVRVGWAVGARDASQARLSGLVAFGGATAFMCMSALVFALLPLPLARLAGAPEDVLPLLLPLLVVSAVFQISDGVQAVGAGVLRGAGETRFTFVANIVGHYAVGLPVALLLGFQLRMGVVGIWWGLCAGLTAVALALLWRFHRLSATGPRPVEA